jgi:hypothetical protein
MFTHCKEVKQPERLTRIFFQISDVEVKDYMRKMFREKFGNSGIGNEIPFMGGQGYG